MTQTATSPPQTTIISTLPLKDTAQATDRLLCIEQDGTLQQLLGSALVSQGAKGDKGDKGDTGEPGEAGKDASLLPLSIIPYYSETPPDDWFLMNGAPFDMEKYPILAKRFPSGKLDDLRDRVLRGAGDFIKLGELQEDAQQNITGSLNTGGNGGFGLFISSTGCISLRNQSTWAGNAHGIGSAPVLYDHAFIDTSEQVRTAAEVRVKAIGVNFIIKAA